jgi:hypothetical protein
MEPIEMPYFDEDVDGYLNRLYNYSTELFTFVTARMASDRLGLTVPGAHVDTGGSCTSSNCFGTTGCTPTTKNGYCACSGPNGPCVWVPGT